MSAREKIVAKPGQFKAGDIVQTLPEGVRWEIVTTRVLDPGPGSDLKFRCRPAWTEDLPLPADRDHVVEREGARAEVPSEAERKIARIGDAIRVWDQMPHSAGADASFVGSVREIMEGRL